MRISTDRVRASAEATRSVHYLHDRQKQRVEALRGSWLWRTPNLFDPFHGTGEAGRNKGLGLGLYIVQQIVHAHRGKVDVVTDDTHQRTVFSVTLPRNYSGIVKVNRVSI